MILFDFSALMHQAIFSAVKMKHPKKENGKLVTSEFIDIVKHIILKNIFDVQNKFPGYKDLTICLDYTHKGNWRSEVYSNYKSMRKKDRAESEINYSEVFAEINKFVEFLAFHSPYRVVSVRTAEADDVILCLAKEFAKTEPVMIISSDKDMIQAQQYGDVKQYSLLTRKFIAPETKHCSNMTDWLTEHVILGDACDEVPRVVDEVEFTPEFKKWSAQKAPGVTPENFYNINSDTRSALIDQFETDMGAQTEIFKKERFGITTLRKRVKEFGSLDAWLDSNPILREHFIRNQKLVLADFIPKNIRQAILQEYAKASTEADFKEFKEWMFENHLGNLILEIPETITKNFNIGFFDF